MASTIYKEKNEKSIIIEDVEKSKMKLSSEHRFYIDNLQNKNCSTQYNNNILGTTPIMNTSTNKSSKLNFIIRCYF